MTKFESETKEKLLEAIRKGAPYEIACNYANIDFKTFWRWMKRGKEEKEQNTEYSQFRQDIKHAEGATALVWLEKIDKAMTEGTWQAAAWKLERRHFKYFSGNPLFQKEFNDLMIKMAKILKIKGINHEEAEEMDSESDT